MGSKFKVPVYGTPHKAVTVDTRATEGAVFGVSLVWPDGRVVTVADLRGDDPDTPNATPTLWRLVREIPRNVEEVENLESAGLVVRQPSQDWITRVVLPTIGRTTVANGDGIAGDIVIDLAVVPNTDGGAILLTEFDAYGRAFKRNPATSDNLDEGDEHLYFTNARAVDALETWDGGPDYLQLLLDEYDPP
ncbi:hypothetical protein [Lysobacter sp. CA199]|uniref:hypothetical protein n=1 Tax=Lysobacter sp. CA199 TaxID=3455608 RepID=UPI003F8D7242